MEAVVAEELRGAGSIGRELVEGEEAVDLVDSLEMIARPPVEEQEARATRKRSRSS